MLRMKVSPLIKPVLLTKGNQKSYDSLITDLESFIWANGQNAKIIDKEEKEFLTKIKEEAK